MDEENNLTPEVAPQETETPIEQVADTEESAQSPVDSTDKEDLILGKFKSQEDLAKAYKELESQHTRERQMAKQAAQVVPEDVPAPFDPDTAKALDNWYTQRRIAEQHQQELVKAQKFEASHAKELEDPLLRGAVSTLIKDENAQGKYLEPEEALSRAKALLDARLKPQIKEAQTQGFEEGKELAQKKQAAGAIGGTKTTIQTDEAQLSASEYAKLHNLPRV